MVVKSTSIDRDPAGRITREETKTRIFAGVVLYQLIYSLSGLALGLSCVIGGIVLYRSQIVTQASSFEESHTSNGSLLLSKTKNWRSCA